MSDIIDTDLGKKKMQNRTCRIAYTLNNSQPVICSYINDQPVFYMDYEGEIEEDLQDTEFFDGSSYGSSFYGHGPIEEAESFSDHQIIDFFENAKTICSDEVQEQQKPSIKALEEMLRKSRIATALLGEAEEHNTTLEYSDVVKHAEYDRMQNVIRISSSLSFTDQILMAARELRRVWQHRNGALIDPISFYPDHSILVHRTQVVDLTIMMIRVAWELQLADEKDAWERLEKSSLFDMARSFARESHIDFRNLNNGMAASAAFETWFLSDRCLKEDKILIQRMLENNKNGCSFDDEQSSFSVMSQLIYALGSVPFGKNYLAPYINTIVEDAIFSEVRDRSNANFLWFVKFERSFSETEQHLQMEDQTAPHDDRSGDLSKNNKQKFGDNEKTATLINLPENGKSDTDPSTQKTRNNRPSKGDNVISFASWTSELCENSTKSTQS